MHSALFMFVFTLILYAVAGICVYPFAESVMSLLPQFVLVALLLPLTWGIYIAYKRQLDGEEMQIGWMFDGYKKNIWITMILQQIYVFLWTLLFIIPGIVKTYSYAMVPYLLKDNPELLPEEAINKSMEMMCGKKMQLFLLDLSFIGWAILCIFTFGIGYFFLAPYVYTARAAFYENVREQEM